MRMGERTKRVLALLTAGAMVFTNTGMDVLASTSIVVGGITSGEDKKGETPAESESESETGTEQESESESETGSEAAYTDQKVFTCEGDQATVTVTVPDEAQMPAGTELEVQPVVENSVTYEEIKNALTNEAQEVLGISAFHLAFTTDGEAQIPSDIDYQVQIDYKDAVLAVAEGQEDSSVGAYVNQAGATADIQTSENGAVEAVSLSTRDLGDVAVVRTGAVATEATKTVYTYEDGNVKVTATLQKADAVPDDATFIVTKLNEVSHGEDYAYAEQKLQEYQEEENVSYSDYLVYDMHFEDKDGNEIEPEEGQVSVNVSYKRARRMSEEASEDSIQVLHLDEEKDVMEDVTDSVNVDEKGKLKEVSLITDSFSIIVIANTGDEIEVKPMTDYSLYNILNNYNTFVKTNVGMGHSVGPVAVGGNYDGQWISGNGYVHKVDSYIKGKANFGGYDPRTTSKYLYLGKENDRRPSWENQIRYIKNDDYIDFNKAFASIAQEAKSVASSISYSTPSGNKLIAGESYNIHINDLGGQLKWEIGENGTSSDSVVYDDSNGTIRFYADASVFGNQTEYNASGMGIVYIFPNATEVVISNASQHLGHIIAPNADVRFEGTMNYAGCIIAKSLQTNGSESHMWPYNGSKIRPASNGFRATKTVDNTEPTAEQVFNFNLSELKKDGDAWKWDTIQTKQNAGSNIVFDDISYSSNAQVGDHWYCISESQNQDVTGYTLSTEQYVVKVSVAKQVNGSETVYNKTVSYYKGNNVLANDSVPDENQLVKISNETEITFNNTTIGESEVPTSESFTAVKKVDGKTPSENQTFTFKLEQIGDVPEGSEKLEEKTTENHGETVDFGSISYSKNGTYYYKISETGTSEKYILDGTSYVVKVEVTSETALEGSTRVTRYSSRASYYKGSSVEDCTEANKVAGVGGIAFNNITYTATGELELEATKVLTGKELTSEEFSFELKNKEGTVLQTKKNDAFGNVKFDKIAYTLDDVGEHVYTVSEGIPEDTNGIMYDNNVYTVEVVVSDNGDGTLQIDKTIKDSDEEKRADITFTNTYYEEGSANLKATKDFSGTTWKDETFQFVLTAGKAEGSEAASPMPEGTVDGSKTVTVTKDSKTAEFGTIVYVNNGTYNYQIHEVNDGQAGITYDGAVWNVQVIVSNGQNGVKNVAIQYKKSTDETYTPWNDANDAFAVTFHNTYAEKGTARIQVAKEFNADEYPTGDDAFTFTLKAAQNEEGTTESPLPEQTTVKVTDANAVSFGDITFDTNGTYNYTVEENAGMLPNVIYDKTVYDVQIKVEDGGKADGVKKITVMSKKQADKEYAPLDGTVFTAAFSNTRYAVNVKKTDLTGVNEVKGATLTVYKASDINEDGTVKENAEKVTEFVSDGGANDISEELIRGEAYVLVETSAPEGYAFTNNIPFTLNEDGTVTVDKELQAEDGTILVKDALIGEQKVPLTATKTLIGAALTGDDFSFTLEEVKEDGTTELLQTKTNDAAGKVAFDDLTYDYKAEGKTFTYVVKEADTQKTGITYSKEAYTVKVVISKADTEGKMTAEVSYTDATGKPADAMNFTNTFAGSVSLVKVGPQQQKLAGAKFMLYQQQPSTDYKAYAETEYVTDANGNIKVEGLPEGNYYFVETTAPDGYVIKMNDDGTAKQYPFTIQAGKAEATVGVDIDLGLIENDTITPGEGGDIDLGSVTIEKSVLNAAGKTITADGTTFYAGVFSKNQDGTYTLVKSATLEQNGKVTIKDLTVGTYYLFETTKQGDRINEADFAFEITGNGQEFQIKSDENTDVKLVNKEKETVESEEETEKESEVKTETKTKKTTTVKTGDTTPIALYVGLLAAAAVLIALIVFLRKRKNK